MEILALLGVGFVCMSAFLIYLLIHIPKSYKLKFLAVPLFLFLACAYVVKIPTVLGLPKRGYPDQEFVLITYKMTFVNQKLFIEAWVVEEGRSRLYQMPFSEGLAEKLRKMAKNGHPGRFNDDLRGDPTLEEIDIPHEPLPEKSQ